jgi:phosphatidylglycerophosphate synthase
MVIQNSAAPPSLLEVFRAAKKPENFWFRVYYGLATPIVWFSTRVGWTPNGLTIASAILNLVALIYSLSAPLTPRAILLAALVFALGYVLDCADGQLAFVTNKRSQLGYWLDSSLDILKSAYFALVLIRLAYAHPAQESAWFEHLVSFAAMGHFVNYSLSLHAHRFRELGDGYSDTNFDRDRKRTGVLQSVIEAIVTHLREYANLIVALSLFALDRRAGMLAVLILGMAHWLFSVNRVAAVGRSFKQSNE